MSGKLTVGFTPQFSPLICNTLELSLESRWSQLGVLKSLKVFLDLRVSTTELKPRN